MDLWISLIILVAVFLILIISDMIHYLLSAGILFMFYMWGYLVFDMTVLQKVFYPLGIVFYIATKAAFTAEGKSLPTNANSADFSRFGLNGVIDGFRYHFVSILIGVVMLGVMFAVSAKAGRFLGVAPLSVSGNGFGSIVTSMFAPTISMSLGFIENRMFIAWLNILLLPGRAMTLFIKALSSVTAMIPFIGPIISAGIMFLIPVSFMFPFIITAVTFGLFHIIAYAVTWNLIWWAAMVMGLWIISYYVTGKDTTAMDTAHGGWNGWLTSQESLSVAL